MFWLLIAVLTICLSYFLLVKPLNYWKERNVVAGNPVPLFGDSWKQFLRLQSLGELVQDQYKIGPGERYCGIFQMMQPTLIIKNPDLIKQITVKDFDHFTDRRSIIDPEVDPLAGKNLLGLKGRAWKDMRSLLSPSFTSSKMRLMFVLMQHTAETFVENFKKINKEIIELDMKDVFTRYTNDIIASVAFGVEVDSLHNPENEFYLMGKHVTNFTGFWSSLKFFGFMSCPAVMKFFRISLFGKKANTFFRELIDKALTLREKNSIARPDMINLFLEARKEAQNNTSTNSDVHSNNGKEGRNNNYLLSNDDITAQALIFFFAGFDPTSTTLCFACYELAMHPDIQNRLRDEILETIEESNGKVTYENLLKMKYLDMVLSETLRRWPVAIVADRICTKAYTIEPVTPREHPIHLNKGDIIWLPIMGLHQDPALFPDPEKFDPERFTDENKGNIHPYAYLPFGVGPRNCIGNRFALLEAKVVLFEILKDFEIVPIEKTPITLKLSRKQFNLFPEGGFHLGLKRVK